MTWIKLDDGFTDHPKIAALPPTAFRLHVAGLCYCGRYLTDGIIPAQAVPQLVRQYRSRDLQWLVRGEVWAKLDQGNAYQIHDYLDWNLSRAEVEKRHAIAASNARQRWRR